MVSSLVDPPCVQDIDNPIQGNFNLHSVADIAAEALISNSGSIFSARPLAKYLTGARCIIKVNGRLAGFAFGVSLNINTEQDEIFGIDDYMPQELAPKRITVSGTLSMFHIPGQGASKMMFQSNVLSFLFHKYITIEIRDSQTDSLIFITKQAVITSRVEDIRAGELSTVQLSWKAIGWQDEEQPQYPGGFDGKSTTVQDTALDLIINAAKKAF
jgi:hypothetical protein